MDWRCLAARTILVITNHIIMIIVTITMIIVTITMIIITITMIIVTITMIVISTLSTTTGEYDGCWTRDALTNRCDDVFILLTESRFFYSSHMLFIGQ